MSIAMQPGFSGGREKTQSKNALGQSLVQGKGDLPGSNVIPWLENYAA